MALFIRGNKNDFLNLLKIPYGFIQIELINADGFTKMYAMTFENSNDISVLYLEQAEALIKIFSAKGQINPKEIQWVRKGMTKHHLLKNMSEIMDIVRNFKLHANFNPRYDFVLCGQNEKCPLPLKHGCLKKKDGKKITNHKAYRLDEALLTFSRVANNPATKGRFSPYELIFLLQQMIKAGLPVDEEELTKNFNNLSEEEKRLQRSPYVQYIKDEDTHKDGGENDGNNLPN